jgi:hypothetical protein
MVKEKLLKKVEEQVNSNWRVIGVNIMDVMRRNHPLGLNYERTEEVARQIIGRLRDEGVTPSFDDQGRMPQPQKNGYMLFCEMFRRACGDKTGTMANSGQLFGRGWREIGTEGQKDWAYACDELKESYKWYVSEGNGKQFLGNLK